MSDNIQVPEEYGGPFTLSEANFFRSIRAIDLSQDQLPLFVSDIGGLTEPNHGHHHVVFRWNKSEVVRLTLRVPLFGRLSVSVVARTRGRIGKPVLVTIGGDTQFLSPRRGRLPAYHLTFECRFPGEIIEFKVPGKQMSFGLAYISIQMDG